MSVVQRAFRRVVVMGSGSMGTGIAQVTASSGIPVTLVDIDENKLRNSENIIRNSCARVAKELFKSDEAKRKNFVDGTIAKLKLSTELEESVREADLVIEAVFENLKLKTELFSKIDKIAEKDTVFASNTSSLSIGELAAATGRRDLFAGLHFFNPVPVMKLLEVVRTPELNEDILSRLMEFGKSIGKTCILCKDTPGFVVNRLLISVLMEAIRMLERGDAAGRDIDTAMKLGAGFPMGPIELCDYVGADVVKNVVDIWHEKYPTNPLFEPSKLLNRLIDEGKMGMKTGEGFYSYKK